MGHTGSHTRLYTLPLDAGQSFHGIVLQSGVDVRITVKGPSGNELEDVDGFQWGAEFITVIAKVRGIYTLAIQASDGHFSGPYEFDVGTVGPSTPEDEVRIRAQRLSTGARQHQSQSDADSLTEAFRLSTAALDLWHGLGEHEAEIGTLSRMGEISYEQREYESARKQFERAGELSVRYNDSRGEGESYNNLGMVDWQTDRPVSAVSNLSTAIRLWQQSDFRYGITAASSNLGILHAQIGDFRSALSDYTRALAGIRGTSDVRGEAYIQHNMGVAYDSLGEPATGLIHIERAVVLFRGAKEPLRAAHSLLVCGRISLALGLNVKALQQVQLALPAIRAAGDRQWEADALESLGRIYSAMGNSLLAGQYYRESLARSRELGYRRGQSNALDSLGNWLSRSGEQEEAEQNFRDALRLRNDLGLREAEAETLFSLAQLEFDRGRFSEARTWIESCLKITETLRTNVPGDGFRTDYLAARHERYELYVDLLMRLNQQSPGYGFDRLALAISERARARGLMDLFADGYSEIRNGVSAELLERERSLIRTVNFESSRLATGPDMGATEQKTRREHLDKLTSDIEELEAQIRSSSPKYAALATPEPLSAEEVQREVAASSDTILLEFFLGSRRSYLWAVTGSGIRSFVLPPKDKVEEAVQRVYRYLRTPPGNGPSVRSEAGYKSSAYWLSRVLLDPVADELGDKTLLIVGDGALQLLPFGVLPIPAGSHASYAPLITRNAVAVLPSVSAISLARERSNGRAVPGRALAVLADPVFDSDDGRVRSAHVAGTSLLGPTASRFGRLVFSRLEAESIYSIVPPPGRMKALDFAASKARATDPALGDYRILHFSTHGIIDEKRPELSGLVLSLVNEKGLSQDGFLGVPEIYNLTLRAELVVLSACDSGLGKRIAGEGVMGLSRAFMYAGAAGLITSSWAVEEESTAELMKVLYKEMFRGPRLSPASALRRAQMTIRRQARWSHPYYWSGFSLQGEWRQ